MPIFVVSFVLSAALLLAGRPEPIAADIAWVARGEFCEPETVLPLPDNTLLVSNVCDFRTQNDGFLTLLGADGQAIDWRRVEGLDSPLGMALLGERLYVVDTNRVRVFAWPDYEPVEVIEIQTSVANDLAVAADGTLFVTDSAKHQVVRRLPNGTQSLVGGGFEFKNANGIALDGEHLYVGGERLWCINLLSNAVTTIGPDWLADIDGIEFEPDGSLQLTPVGGPLIRYRNENDVVIIAGEGVSSANHGYAANLSLALIPTGFDNTVIALQLQTALDDK